MPIETLSNGEPFFGLRVVSDERDFKIEGRAIVLNLGTSGLDIIAQSIAPLTSVIVQDVTVPKVERALIVVRFDAYPDEAALMADIRTQWPSAFEVRGEDRLRGIEHYMSPKIWVGQTGLTFYHSASVPLNVGLHKDHPFCPVPGFREVHTQIVGLGKMQQCREKSLDTLYLEEVMAPGVTHKPMFDADGNYPWHQFETITPSVFLAVEMLPEGAKIPA
ncbi:MAG: hypothetical protein AAFN59_03310 [Pseudomonadota bacterium]